MVRVIEKLTDLKARHAKEPGRYPDGAGLYLQVTASRRSELPNRSWILRVMVPALDRDGAMKAKVRELGLGRYPEVGLAEARSKANAARAIASQGEDPVTREAEARRAKLLAEQEAALAQARTMSFAECAEAYIASHKARWRNEKHLQQWISTLATYAYPVLGDLPVAAIDVALVTKVIDPIWNTKSETASRLRGRIEAILDWATVRGHRSGDNPARWKGHLEKALPQQSKVAVRKHHSALAFDKAGEFMTQLRAQKGASARALEFTILTAARTGETIGATIAEIDFANRVWVVPKSRMKGGREHRVPLSPAALKIITDLWPDPARRDGKMWLFTPDGRRPLSNMAMLMMLRRMKHDDLTVHGFRSSFRDWAAEKTDFPSEVAEAALAHAIGNKVEAAYRRGDLFSKREALMRSWAEHCKSHSPLSRV